MARRADVDPSYSPDAVLFDYALMRATARGYLGQIGVGTNPGFTDRNIIDALRTSAGMDPAKPWNESLTLGIEKSAETFKGQLTEILTAAGVSPIEPVTATSIVMAFERLGTNA